MNVETLRERMDGRLGGVRAAIKAQAGTFHPAPDMEHYIDTPDGPINFETLYRLTPKNMETSDFERRVSIMYNGDGEQLERMLDHWDDKEYSDFLIDEVEDTGHVLDYDLRECDMWEPED